MHRHPPLLYRNERTPLYWQTLHRYKSVKSRSDISGDINIKNTFSVQRENSTCRVKLKIWRYLTQRDIITQPDEIQNTIMCARGWKVCVCQRLTHQFTLTLTNQLPATHDPSTVRGKWLLNIATVQYCFMFPGRPVMENKVLLWFCCSGFWSNIQCAEEEIEFMKWFFFSSLCLDYHRPSNTPLSYVNVSVLGEL